ncbi:hypothetical protein ABEB36_006857 [Hypothenemus hampei]|uniref:Uncharacterized protein n=1 Tax=Hypothenemus hampei TaxID=57062 RepID=A0ABD1ES08_HYPHA
MYSSMKITIFSCFYVVVITKVSAEYYCESAICDVTIEYCCGENKCCKKTVEVWYYWAVMLLVFIVLIIAACFYMKRLRNKYSSYSKLEQKFDEVITTQA